jgi:molybdopterin synthase catalytic subunit
MTVRVRLFAVLRDRAGMETLDLSLPNGAGVADAATAMSQEVPSIRDLLPRCRYAVNAELANDETLLRDGDELAVLPPVSGG